MGLLEKVFRISLFIALAPIKGFMGTVIGMIEAFDAIQIAGDISPSLVAGGINSLINNRIWTNCSNYITNIL